MQMFSSSLSVYFNCWNMLNLFTFWEMQPSLQRNTALKHPVSLSKKKKKNQYEANIGHFLTYSKLNKKITGNAKMVYICKEAL